MTELQQLVFRRYPDKEWATFARFGWRPVPEGLVLTLAALEPPRERDLNENVGHVAIAEPYTLRIALAAEQHTLAIGVIHSHPRECVPLPSHVDDDMDVYYADYFASFAPSRPYVSLIISLTNDQLAVSGRVCWQGKWLAVERVAVERAPVHTWRQRSRSPIDTTRLERTARLSAAFGEEAAHRLRDSTVAVIGVGGTGSAAVEVLARAGVGHLILIDPDHVEASNLERIHGSVPKHVAERTPKVSAARDHIRSIDPSIMVDALIGRLPQPEVTDAVVTADVVLGCTDQQHSRLALSDLALRYVVPAIDCGVALEGDGGAVTGQILQFVRFLAADPCVLCRRMIIPERITRELMSERERTERRRAAEEARARGENPNPYWRDEPQLNTVGYLTTMAGALAAGYAIGWLTGRFDIPFSRIQLNLVESLLGTVEIEDSPRSDCICRRIRGWADQAIADSLITPPDHWQPPHTV
jgi:molybdopterin/thiamine biosynthesis adenylyltransferase